MMQVAVFLDRDGTLIEEREYLSSPEEVVFIPGAIAALERLQDAGYLLILVTNQSGVGRGYFSKEAMEQVHRHMMEMLAASNVSFAAVYAATEAPDQPSRGRKPSPQFLFDARDAFGIDLARSVVIGDKLSDLECGRRADVKESLLVRTGYGRDTEKNLENGWERLRVFDDLSAAAEALSARC